MHQHHHAHEHHLTVTSASLLRLSAVARVGIAGALLSGLWAVVWWVIRT